MAAKKYETIKVEKGEGITWVTFNRPDKRNAMSPQLHLDMDDVLDELAIDDETEILVITGAGESFSAGQDIRLYFRGTEADPAMRHKARRASNQWRWQKLSTFPKADHRDGQRLLLRRRLHAGRGLRLRVRGR